ncbi:hypothetical protein HPB50_020569 [Hyalomma asiaticum]|uniref:Uncharacterized protein n=1 Tax=Hyalomma asiaticum TaxID=266040 RepID=A0ACB7SJH1_HYAAI|nr:hypothetical protein HPB50_020569 [Hyalomma asiaticum]
MHEEQRKKRTPAKRRWWIRPALQKRAMLVHANTLLPHLRSRDVEYYRDYLRMPPGSFETLLKLVASRIRKTDTRFRKAIPPEHRLALAMRQLLDSAFVPSKDQDEASRNVMFSLLLQIFGCRRDSSDVFIQFPSRTLYCLRHCVRSVPSDMGSRWTVVCDVPIVCC